MSRSAAFDRSNPEVIKGAQVRAGRALLDWSIPEAAKRCSVGVNTIRRFENGERLPGGDILREIVRAFEENGVLFIDTVIGVGVILNDRKLLRAQTRRGGAGQGKGDDTFGPISS